MADLLRDKLGIYQHRNWRQAFDEHPYALRAQMAFTLPRSASFDVIGPTRFDSDLGLHLHNWGLGPTTPASTRPNSKAVLASH